MQLPDLFDGLDKKKLAVVGGLCGVMVLFAVVMVFKSCSLRLGGEPSSPALPAPWEVTENLTSPADKADFDTLAAMTLDQLTTEEQKRYDAVLKDSANAAAAAAHSRAAKVIAYRLDEAGRKK